MFGLREWEDGVAVTGLQKPGDGAGLGKIGNLVSDMLCMRCLFDIHMERPAGRQIFES